MKIPSDNKNPSTRNGFTLVEILVTITIIITLAALSVVGLRRAKASASAAVDANDLRGIGAAVQMYAGDKNGFLPVTASGISPTYNKNNPTLNTALAPYLGRENPQDGEFLPEFAASSWQKATKVSTAPSLLAHQAIYTGAGKFDGNPMRPEPNMTTFGYPFGTKREPKQLSAVMSACNPANSLMLTEIDKLHPEFKASKPSWLNEVPDGMAHGTFRLGLYWDGHVGSLDVDLNPK